jgi:hypothetical protein
MYRSVRTSLRVGVRAGPVLEVLKKRLGTETRWQEITGNEIVLQGNPAALADGQRVEISASKE